MHQATDLTKREQEVLQLISTGLNAREISTLLFLSPHTVITHKRNIAMKLQAKNVANLVRRGFETGALRVSAN